VPPPTPSWASQHAAAAVSKACSSGPHSSRTTITPVVNVPVLSLQITVALPSVSTAGSLRINTFRVAIRRTPMASAMVTMAGSPSGTAATASDTAAMKTCSAGIPRASPATAVTATIPRHSAISTRLTRASRACKGVVVTDAPAMRWAIFPSSVFIPVAATSARPLPAAMAVPMKTMSRRSARGAPATATSTVLPAGTLSPVSTASFADSWLASSTRASAATMSPASSSRRSPGTTSTAGTTTGRPSRTTVARGAVNERKASRASSARRS
jgi:hypothetical protein